MAKGRKTLRFSFVALLLLCLPAFAGHSYKDLRPSSKYWDRAQRSVPVNITRLSSNRKLASVGDTVYMLDARNRVIWKWSSQGPPLTDQPILDSSGIIYAIGFDLVWVALDSKTGKQKWKGTACGRAVYSQIGIYKRDVYFVVTDMEGYRESLNDKRIKDGLSLCKGNSILWETKIPAGNRIEVKANRVVAVQRRRGRTLRKLIAIPERFGAPIGRVSVLAKYD